MITYLPALLFAVSFVLLLLALDILVTAYELYHSQGNDRTFWELVVEQLTLHRRRE